MSDIIYNFTDSLKIRFEYRNSDYYPYVERGEEIQKIPLLFGHIELSIAMKNMKDIRGFDLPFNAFCQVVTGYLSTVLKYKSRDCLALASEFKDP